MLADALAACAVTAAGESGDLTQGPTKIGVAAEAKRYPETSAPGKAERNAQPNARAWEMTANRDLQGL